ncbi:MAG: hypothetical protein BAJATHORv1_20047 [Candidatus Thorarchaeota archaeon]|nr:MAG: hypothetical protein BAJATHORv1_20047 [Candidatus Thorarchaeota archaeon]
MNQDKLRLLFKLQEHPMAPAVQLAKEVQISPPTAKAWLDSLKKEQVYIGVQPNLRVRRLGLEIDDFLLEVDSYNALVKIEQFCEKHPYTLYRARVFGGSSQGIMVQFRQPDKARKHLEDALEILKERGYIKNIRELPTLNPVYGSTYTRPRLEAWDPKRMVWVFDWDEWWKKESTKSNRTIEEIEDAKGRIPLDKLDAKILEMITRDARQKNTEIIESIGLDKSQMGIQQDFSKRLKKLNEAVESYRVFINWNHFDVYNTPLIIANADKEITEQLIRKLQMGEFPFGSSIRQTKTGFVWSARMPSAHFSELISLVWKISIDYELLIIDYKNSQRYALWAETFDPEQNDWKADREFCLEKPLMSIDIL